MRIEKLDLKYVGPFQEATLDFSGAPVSVITGLNGTGKSLLLEVIGFSCLNVALMRDTLPSNIFTFGKESLGSVVLAGEYKGMNKKWNYINSFNDEREVRDITTQSVAVYDFLLANWITKEISDDYGIPALEVPQSLKGSNLVAAFRWGFSNSFVTKCIVYYDYLRTSNSELDKLQGESFFKLLNSLMDSIFLDSEAAQFVEVERRTLTPYFKSHEFLVPISITNLGYQYILKRMVSIIHNVIESGFQSKKYSNDIHLIPGFLLIDEPESHLHPELQKRIIPTLRELFPNIQIICTTHSPFIIASAGDDAKFFVTKKDEGNLPWCTVEEVTDKLVNKPIEEILISEAFNGTLPYNQEISEKLEQRREALERGDLDAATKIENELMAINPTSFAYLNIR